MTVNEFKCIDSWIHALAENGLDGIILSDYAKGICSRELCQQIIKFANERSIPVLVDPKGKDWSKYSGRSFITPNLKEISDVSGHNVSNEDAEVVEAAHESAVKFNIKNVIVTRSEKGLTLVHDDAIIHKAADAQEVFDVSGAGDTAAATLLAAIAGAVYQRKKRWFWLIWRQVLLFLRWGHILFIRKSSCRKFMKLADSRKNVTEAESLFLLLS